MFIFAKDSYNNRKIIFPASRVIDIYTFDCSIIINYDNGELIEVDGAISKKIVTITIKYDDVADVSNAIQNFYTACKNKVDAFYFGDNGGSELNE